MILVIGAAHDGVLKHWFDYCILHHCAFSFVDPKRLDRDIHFDENFWYFPETAPIPHAIFSGVYNRFLYHERTSITQWQTQLKLFDWLDNRYPCVVNRPKDTMSNLSKPYQLELARQFSAWRIPKTNIVMNAAMEIKQPMICKSISSVRSVVDRVYQDESKSFFEPALLQEYLPGLNIRVHVCQKTVVAVSIQSQAIDYRYAASPNQMGLYVLPKCIDQACVDLSEYLKLTFCGIDLIYHDGEYFFLEANPSPGYAYFENALKQPLISNALYRCLTQRKT